MFGGKAEIGRTAGNGADDIGALALLDVKTDIGILAQEEPRALGGAPTGRRCWLADERSP